MSDDRAIVHKFLCLTCQALDELLYGTSAVVFLSMYKTKWHVTSAPIDAK